MRKKKILMISPHRGMIIFLVQLVLAMLLILSQPYDHTVVVTHSLLPVVSICFYAMIYAMISQQKQFLLTLVVNLLMNNVPKWSDTLIHFAPFEG